MDFTINWLVIGLIAIGFIDFVAWVFFFADCATNNKINDDTKMLCLVLIFFFNIIGGIIYWITYRDGD